MKGKIILALDKPLAKEMLKKLGEEIYGLKIGNPLIYELGVNGIRELIKGTGFDEIIADLKLADIDNTMIMLVQKFLDVVDSYIAHSFIGYEGALDKLRDYLELNNKGLYLVTSMSHKGWNDSFYDTFIKNVIIRTGPKGLVVGATKPLMVQKVRRDFSNKVIISPGIGIQGADLGSAICNGADYEIVGRAIYDSKDPLNTTKELIVIQQRKTSECETAKT